MNTHDYDKTADGLLALARSIETSKRPGYTIGSEDVLANFKAVAERAGITTEQAWAVYFLKHIDAITSIMTRPDLPMAEAADGRFADAINYLRLGWAILHERGNNTTAKALAIANEAEAIIAETQVERCGRCEGTPVVRPVRPNLGPLCVFCFKDMTATLIPHNEAEVKFVPVGEHGQWIKA